MRAVVQRVSSASVDVEGKRAASIGGGLLVLLGVGRDDGPADVAWLASKVSDLRIFADEAGKMNRSVVEIRGEILLVPQFTLFGDCRKGRRPSFDAAAAPHLGAALYEDVAHSLRAGGVKVETGVFGAHMQVGLVNDGPVTLLLDSRKAF